MQNAPHPCPLCGGRGQVSKFLRSFPIETIVYIFSLCIPQLDPREHTTKHEAAEVLRLASICRRLRSLVHSTPALWTTAVFFPEPEQDYQYMSQWLSRAKSLPLSLRIDYVQEASSYPMHSWNVDEGVRKKMVSRSMACLSPFLQQCTHLDIKIAQITPDTLPKTPGALERLQSFTIWVKEISLFSYLPVRLDSLVAPNLTCATVEGAVLDPIYQPEPMRTSLPWENLVHIEMSRIYPDDVLEILKPSPKVETLAVWTLEDPLVDENKDVARTPVTAPNLRVFDWQGFISPNVSPILDAITAPALTQLRLVPRLSDAYIHPFLPFIRRVTPTLTLFVTTTFPEDDELLNIWALSDQMTLIHSEVEVKDPTYFRTSLTPAAYAASLKNQPDDEQWDDVIFYLPPICPTQ